MMMPLKIGNFQPDRGKPRDRIRITGEGFERGTKVIFFPDREGYNVEVKTAGELTVEVPEVVETGVIHLKNPDGEISSSSKSFTVVEPPIYITGVKPKSGEPGEKITIAGHGFDHGPVGQGTVMFGTYKATSVDWSSDILIRATIPLNAKRGQVYIEVKTHRGTARTAFTID